MVLLVFQLPAKKQNKSQQCVKQGPWFTTLQEIGRMNFEQAFHIQHYVYEV